MKRPQQGDTVRVTTDTFSHSFPRGTVATVVNVTVANTPPVLYYIVDDARGREIGLYRDEFEILGGEG